MEQQENHGPDVPETFQQLMEEIGLEKFGEQLSDEKPPVPVNEDLLRAFHQHKLEGAQRDQLLHLIAEYRVWHDAAIKTALEMGDQQGDK